MATIFHCDRCDKTSNSRNDIMSVEVPFVRPYKSELEEKNADLCTSCLQRLYEFIQPLPKEVKK